MPPPSKAVRKSAPSTPSHPSSELVVYGEPVTIAQLHHNNHMLTRGMGLYDQMVGSNLLQIERLTRNTTGMITSLGPDVLKYLFETVISTNIAYGTYEAVHNLCALTETCKTFRDTVDTKTWMMVNLSQACQDAISDVSGDFETKFANTMRYIPSRVWARLNRNMTAIIKRRDLDLLGPPYSNAVLTGQFIGHGPPSALWLMLWNQSRPMWSAPGTIIKSFYVDLYMTFTQTEALKLTKLRPSHFNLVPCATKPSGHGEGEQTFIYTYPSLRAALRAHNSEYSFIRSQRVLQKMCAVAGIRLSGTGTVAETRSALCMALGAYLKEAMPWAENGSAQHPIEVD